MAKDKGHASDTHHASSGSSSKKSSASGEVHHEGTEYESERAEKSVVRSPTLPVEPKTPAGEPVGPARHAETAEEVAKIQDMERSKIPPPGSRNYVAGQPVNEEEFEQTQAEANRLADAGKAQRSEAERRVAENNPFDPDYHPVDPDHPDTSKSRG
jgi:hypothetical protein